MGKYSVYAVASGRSPGLYSSWSETESQVRQYSGSQYKGFHSQAEAQAYLDARAPSNNYSLGGASSSYSSGTYAPARAPQSYRSSHHDDYYPTASYSSASYPTSTPRSAPPAADQPLGAPLPPTEPTTAARPTATGSKSLRLEFDGASKNNPGPAGLGAVLYDSGSGEVVARVSHYMGHRTNNQAEYGGLIAGLQAARDLGCDDIDVVGDSQLVINQVKGLWRVQHEGLKPYHAAATELLGSFDKVEARQVPRSQNAAADALSNQAISQHRSGATSGVWELGSATSK